jgi:hypothetical protein
MTEVICARRANLIYPHLMLEPMTTGEFTEESFGIVRLGISQDGGIVTKCDQL